MDSPETHGRYIKPGDDLLTSAERRQWRDKLFEERKKFTTGERFSKAKKNLIEAKRKEQLSKTRRKTSEKIKEGAKKAAINLFSDANAAKKISWLEIIFIPLPLALANDALDLFEITVIAKLGTILIDIATTAILFIWFWLRVRQHPGKKLFRQGITFFAEIIPILAFLPMWTLLVLAVKVGWIRAIITLPEKILML